MDENKEAIEEWKRELEAWKLEWGAEMEGWKAELDGWRAELEGWRMESDQAIREGEPVPPMPTMPPMPAMPPMPPMPPMAPMFMGSMRRVRQTLSSRSNVVASRIGDEELRAIDMLIEAGLFNTRSEAVAYLVGEGIKARKDTFDKVSTTLQEIRKIKGEADEYLARLRKDVGLVTTEAYGKSETQPVLWKPQPESQPVRQVKKCPECGRDLANLPADIKACPYCSFKLEKE